MNRTENQMLLIRITLGLSLIHDPVIAVRTLFQEGRAAFEKLRGPECEHAYQWKPDALLSARKGGG